MTELPEEKIFLLSLALNYCQNDSFFQSQKEILSNKILNLETLLELSKKGKENTRSREEMLEITVGKLLEEGNFPRAHQFGKYVTQILTS